MRRRPLLDVFSPLPPLPTDVGNHTVGVLRALAELAQVRVWTSQAGPIELAVPQVEVRRFGPEPPHPADLNRADATFYNLGNNAGFHRDIHAVARRVPGIVILHDTRLQHFFAAYSEQAGPERDYYLGQLQREYGREVRAMGEEFIEGRRDLGDLVAVAPMTLAAVEGAAGAVFHNAADRDALARSTPVPLYYLPLSFRYGPAPSRVGGRGAGEPTRLVMFGFIGENRRLLPVLEALAAMPDRQDYRLDLYGTIEQEAATDDAIAAGGLGGIVRRHGFVPEAELDRALAEADLALNLRWPSMGEASGSQLRIWAAKLPALVTRVGWYAQLPPDTVFAIEQGQEREQLVAHLRAVRADPGRYRAAGARGRAVLEQLHSPRSYAEGLLAIAAEGGGQHARRVGHGLAERAARLLLELGPPELARPLGGEVARRIADLTGT